LNGCAPAGTWRGRGGAVVGSPAGVVGGGSLCCVDPPPSPPPPGPAGGQSTGAPDMSVPRRRATGKPPLHTHTHPTTTTTTPHPPHATTTHPQPPRTPRTSRARRPQRVSLQRLQGVLVIGAQRGKARRSARLRTHAEGAAGGSTGMRAADADAGGGRRARRLRCRGPNLLGQQGSKSWRQAGWRHAKRTERSTPGVSGEGAWSCRRRRR
jgi:hypothetical protein